MSVDLKARLAELTAQYPARDLYEYQVLSHVVTIPGDGPEQEAMRQRTYERAMQNAPPFAPSRE